jgi:allantoinase
MRKYDLILRNGYIVTEKGVSKGDIAIKSGKIFAISFLDHLQGDESNEMDVTDQYILPGLIDSHVHFNEPGRTNWEGFKTGSKALAAGGVTTFFDMPLNSHPATITKEAFDLKYSRGLEKSLINFFLWGGLVPSNLNQLEKLKDCGVIGFKAFMSNSGIEDFEACDDEHLIKGMEKISELQSLLAVHAESQMITEHLTEALVRKGEFLAETFSQSRPILSEIEAVQRIITYAKLTNCKIHIVHVTSSEVIDQITAAKNQGVDVTVETCPHYLSLTTADLEEKGAIAKCAPPLRQAEVVEKLWDSLKNGEIDIIGSDHSPSPPELKEGHFINAWGGISGAQTTLNVLLEEGYWKRNISLETIVRLTATNPAKRFNLYPKKGVLEVGSDADLTIIDLNETFVLKKEDLFYKHQQSPFVGKHFRGKVNYTFVMGNLVYTACKEEKFS